MKNVLFLCCGLLWATTGHAQSVKELAQDVRDSVVLLEILDAAGDEVSGGTGFAIASNIVATNFHVIDGADRIRVAFGHAEPVEAIALLSTDEKNDLALLLLPDQAALAPLSFASGSPEPGDRVVVVGNPLGLTGSISEGIISAVRSEGLGPDSVDFSETPLLQITAPISPGSSGSPVFSSTGEVVGVAVAYYHGAQNLNFAIPVRLVAQLQKGADTSKPLRRLGAAAARGAVIRNLIVSAMFFAAILVAFRLMRAPAPASEPPQRQQSPPRIKLPPRRPKGWG